MSPCEVCLEEWQTLKPTPDSPLYKRELLVSETLAEELSHSRQLEVLSLSKGLQVSATSWVGRVTFGDLTITIRPKIEGTPFLRLLRYAYELRQLALKDATRFSPEFGTFQEIVAHQLALEVEELIAAGLHRDYQRTSSDLSLPRGKLDFQKYVTNTAGSKASLPCIHYPRSHETMLNRVILAGMLLGARLVNDRELRYRLRRLGKSLAVTQPLKELNWTNINRVRQAIDRRTRSYEPALNLITLLMEGMGVSTLDDSEESMNLPGFLFDMNRFFQTLISRFLHENLAGFTIVDERSLRGLFNYAPHGNPQNRDSPKLRPDFVVRQSNVDVQILDAKYRDLWERNLPREMLYQLAVYALNHKVANREAVILYPTLQPLAMDQIISLNRPTDDVETARIILRPVDLLKLDTLVNTTFTASGTHDRNTYANELVFGRKNRTVL